MIYSNTNDKLWKNTNNAKIEDQFFWNLKAMKCILLTVFMRYTTNVRKLNDKFEQNLSFTMFLTIKQDIVIYY